METEERRGIGKEANGEVNGRCKEKNKRDEERRETLMGK